MPVGGSASEVCSLPDRALLLDRGVLLFPGITTVSEERAGYGARPRLLDGMREAIRTRHYSRSTERTYCAWIRRFILFHLFHGKRHPLDMGAPEVGRFLSWLATEAKVSASTQNQALAAILFLYRVILLPVAAKDALARQLDRVRCQHLQDLQDGAGWVELPDAVSRKYPSAGREWPWQWVFPATRVYVDGVTGERRRHHLHESVMQRA